MDRTTDLLIRQFRVRVFEESIPRINKCLDQLSEQAVWKRPSANLVSIGNLILHLEGNARQWILAALYGENDNRRRSEEFDRTDPIPKKELSAILNNLERDIETAFDSNVPDLSKMYHPQVFEEDGVSILVHVIEHFSYHTGQIAFATKLITGDDLKFYGDMNLEV